MGPDLDRVLLLAEPLIVVVAVFAYVFLKVRLH
jgi:hypothetical protein